MRQHDSTAQPGEDLEQRQPLANTREVFSGPEQKGKVEQVKTMTRSEHRAERQRRFVTHKEARLAAQSARLDFKVTNESGALRRPTHSLSRLSVTGFRLPRPRRSCLPVHLSSQ